MQYSVYLVPGGGLKDRIEEVSQQMVREVYGREIQHVLYRVKSKPLADNHHKLYIPGAGTIHELDVIPHSTLVLPFSADDEDGIERLLRDVAPERFSCEMQGIGDYGGQQFTFFIKLSPEPRLFELQRTLQEAIVDKYGLGQRINEYDPHITLLYDDVDEHLAAAARTKVNEQEFTGRLDVNYISLCRQEGPNIFVVREIPLKDGL